MLRFLLDAQAVPVLVELRHAVTFRIVHPVAEYGGLSFLFRRAYRFLQHGAESVPVEDVVTQYQAGAIITDKLLSDKESLRQSVG